MCGAFARPALLATGVFITAWLASRWAFEVDVRFSDVPLYRRYGELMASGSLPYRDFEVEYPPGALPLFVLPALVSSDLAGFRLGLELVLVACGALAIGSMASILSMVHATRRETMVALGLIALTPLMLGRVVAERFDLLPAALSVAALAAALANRHRAGGLLLGLAVAAKLYPVVMLPLLLVYALRRVGRAAAFRSLTAFAIVVAVWFGVFAIAAPDAVLAMLERQADRPLQIESLGAAMLLAAHQIAGVSLGIDVSFGSVNLGGSRPEAAALATTALAAVTILAVWWSFVRGRREATDLLLGAATTVCALVALGKVFSPQFLLWLIPLVPLVRGRRGLQASLLLAAACLITHAYFPSRYLALIKLDAMASWLVVVRDAVLVAVLALLLSAVYARRGRLGDPSP